MSLQKFISYLNKTLDFRSLRRLSHVPLRLQQRRALLDLADNIGDHVVIIGFAGFFAGGVHHAIACAAACEAGLITAYFNFSVTSS